MVGGEPLPSISIISICRADRSCVRMALRPVAVVHVLLQEQAGMRGPPAALGQPGGAGGGGAAVGAAAAGGGGGAAGGAKAAVAAGGGAGGAPHGRERHSSSNSRAAALPADGSNANACHTTRHDKEAAADLEWLCRSFTNQQLLETPRAAAAAASIGAAGVGARAAGSPGQGWAIGRQQVVGTAAGAGDAGGGAATGGGAGIREERGGLSAQACIHHQMQVRWSGQVGVTVHCSAWELSWGLPVVKRWQTLQMVMSWFMPGNMHFS